MTSSHIPVKPPKPPCWLDLKAQKSSSDEGGARLSPVGHPNSTCRAGKTGKRTRPKLHRTRSQFCIQSEDLPDCELTTSLAETKPEDLGLGKEIYDDNFIMQQTTRKCRNWLQSIEGCGPPDMTSCLSSPDEEAVDVEVPDDTHWYDEPEVHPLYNSSASTSDLDFNVSSSNISQHEPTPKTKRRTSGMRKPGRKYELRSVHGRDILNTGDSSVIK